VSEIERLQNDAATLRAIEANSDHGCAKCGTLIVSVSPLREKITVGIPGEEVEVEVERPLWTCCNGCESNEGGRPFQWFDWTAEFASEAAVKIHWLTKENIRLQGVVEDAASSLEAAGDSQKTHDYEIRAYCQNRAGVARAALLPKQATP